MDNSLFSHDFQKSSSIPLNPHFATLHGSCLAILDYILSYEEQLVKIDTSSIFKIVGKNYQKVDWGLNECTRFGGSLMI